MRIDANNILVLRMSGVGDVLWTTPFLANLRRGCPGARLSYVVRASCAPVLGNNNDIDELIVFKGGGLRQQIGFLRDLRSRRFDLAIDLVGTPRTAIQALVCGAGHRLGYDFGYRRLFYNHLLSARKANYGHEVEFNLYALGYLGIPVRTKALVYNMTAGEIDYRRETYKNIGLSSDAPVIGLMPTGGWECKRWPVEYFIELGRSCAGRGGIRFLVFWGGPSEQRDARAIADGIGQAAVAAPATDLRQMAALLSGCTAVVGNDSGPLHIATALGVPVISFYGPTSPRGQGPWGEGHAVLRDESLSCLVCNRTDCQRPRCMEGIKPAAAIKALDGLLNRVKK